MPNKMNDPCHTYKAIGPRWNPFDTNHLVMPVGLVRDIQYLGAEPF